MMKSSENSCPKKAFRPLTPKLNIMTAESTKESTISNESKEEFTCFRMATFTWAIGKRIFSMGRAYIITLTGISLQGTTKKERKKDSEFMFIKVVLTTKVNGRTIEKMVRESFITPMNSSITENGSMVKNTAKAAPIHIKTVINTSANG
jgi:hypothetical protein